MECYSCDMMGGRSTLRDVWNHHAWADAEHWRAFTAHPVVLEDEALFKRLHHLHVTQSSWVWAIGDRSDDFTFRKHTDFVPALTLRAFAIQNHTALSTLAASEESALDRPIPIPWFDNLVMLRTVCKSS